MTETAATLSIVKLFMNADSVVKGVLLLLLAASVWSWAVIIDKLWRLGAASRAAREHEARPPRRARRKSCRRQRGGTPLASSYRPASPRARSSRGRNPRRRVNVASASSARCG